MTIDEIYEIPVNGQGWRVLPNGNYVTLGDGVTLEHSPIAVQGPYYLVTLVGPNTIQAGCQIHSFAHWLENVESIGKDAGVSEADCVIYRRIIEFIVSMSK